MNKLCLPLLLILLTLAGCTEDPPEVPSPERRLKSATAYMAFYDDGQQTPLSGGYKWSSESYNPDGLVTDKEYREDKHLDGPYHWLTKESNKYENGVLKERIVLSPRTNTTRYVYTYTDGRLTEMEEYGNSGLLYCTYKYEYSGSASPARMQQFFPGQTVPFVEHAYTYDEKGHVTREHIVYFNGSATTVESVYDEKGNLTRETVDPGGGFPPYTRKLINYTYDAKGRISEREFSTFQDMRFQKWVYHYDDDEKSRNMGRLKFIDVYEATTKEGREYKLKGLLNYVYVYDYELS